MSGNSGRAKELAEYERLRVENVEARREYYEERSKVQADPTRSTATLSSLGDILGKAHRALLNKADELEIPPQYTAHLDPYKGQ
ncbi:hypothetical protein [Burkholderia cepacia]|uniref:hypothetical protein n=1 Tax=Burkholderia cepacia TaxID=292 RepID=UPI000AC60FAD|nr:hypothetical protein [Burkholderia cepacia]